MSSPSRFRLSDAVAEIEFCSSAQPDRLMILEPDHLKGREAFYEEWYKTAAALERTRRLQFTRLLKVLNSLNPNLEKTLDVGAGNGFFLEMMQEEFPRAEHLAIDPYSENPKVSRLSFEAFRQKSSAASFDLISFLDSLEHFENPKDVLKQSAELLCDRGLVLIKVPNRDAFLYRFVKVLRHALPGLSQKVFRRLYQVDYPPPHYYYFNRKSLTSFLEPGFEVVRVDYISELPFRSIRSRLWGVSALGKLALCFLLPVYRLLSLGPFNDSLILIARRKRSSVQ